MTSIAWSDVAVACAVFLVGWLVSLVHTALRPGLRNIPGPWMAKISQFRRLSLVWNGNAHQNYRVLHVKYGPIVRTAPNVVDVSEPAAISTIYGIGSKFRKVFTTKQTILELKILSDYLDVVSLLSDVVVLLRGRDNAKHVYDY